MTTIERHFVRTRSGRRHVAEAGSGPAVLLLHQTPRSWDEYRDLLPLLGRHVRAIALDTPGFGDSDPLPDGPPSIEAWAAAALDLLDARGIDRAVVVGHHTGAVIALEMAARAPERLPALVLSACPMVDAPRRAHHAGRRVVDEVERGPHGQHLGALWQARASFYPPDRPDLLERFVVDALKAGDLAVEGHRVVNRYHMETRLPRVTCPTLVIDPLADPHAHPSAARIAAAIPGAQLVPIEGGMVPLPDQHPTAFAAAILDFLAAQRWTGDALPPSAGDALRSRHGQR
ncbi:MAG: alpha/beta fold hydrolase [Rhodospirillales bacterium]|nr:alpha/beta fold hydrolase [Rhodospirillales bacterium]